MSETSLNIYQRINEVRKAVAYVKKDATVKQGGTYKAVSHDAVTSACREHLVKYGVIVVPSFIQGSMTNTGTVTSSGTPIMRYEALFEVQFINCDEPEDKFSLKVPAHANDTGDKAPGKAITYATKSALLKALSLETGEEDESRVESGKPKNITEEQAIKLENLIDEVGAEKHKVLTWLKVSDLTEIPASRYQTAVDALERKRAKEGA